MQCPIIGIGGRIVKKALLFVYTQVAPAPDEAVLVYKSDRAKELLNKSILFNWAGVGWCAGNIIRVNTDGRAKIKVGGKLTVANFYAFYSDETEAKHCLALEDYGADGGVQDEGRWVLLEEVAAV